MNKRLTKTTILYFIFLQLLFMASRSFSMNCPDFAHLITTEGIQSEMPDGFFVYGIYGQNGIFISNIQQYSPQVLPYTRKDVPTDIAISANGKWVLYNSNGVPYLTRISPSCKVKVPISSATTSNVCFWRDQPNGQEAICYMVNPSTIRAIEVQFAGNSVDFRNDRIIVSLGDSLRIIPGMRLCVSSDQLFSAIHPDNNGSFSDWQTVYLTLPKGGQGVATGANIYQWANDTTIHRGGCAHAMSWDGTLCAADLGIMSYSSCLPHEHKGFTVTPFWHDTLAPQLMEQSVDEHAISINWCPERYRAGNAVEMNFWDWYFGNSNDYLIGNQRGDLADRHGIWLVRWEDNHWTFLTDPLVKIEAYQPAVHFCSMDTVEIDTIQVNDTAQVTDPNDPCYEIVYPNGGEVIWYGDTLRLKIKSKMHGNVVIRLSPL